jgi:sRNA-binding carbon storage regulator CsrA
MSRLVIDRKVGQRVRIGEAVVEIVSNGNGKVRLCIEADPSIPIVREEIEARRTLTLTRGERELVKAK